MKRRQRGMTLIEVLIAMLVMSVGMLGIAGLQAVVGKYQTGSRVRAKMGPLLQDIADRVRLNPTQAGDNVITGIASTSAYTLTSNWSTQSASDPTAPTRDCETGSVTCSPSERAAYDLAIWRQRVRAAMPTGSALLTGNRATGFQVTLMWMDKDQTIVGDANAALATAPVCSTSAEVANANRMGQQNCCPQAAAAPAGVRCTNFTFIP
ncbi:type IV pilus modification protein PilV [Xylophilus sp. GOD-11R]|uniref:type IV pilus modification protein PilV n=1 Tax=Xylophilus sp. GOD-11R TaxID=3089814 RepID=UPI00298CC91C|nr:type IV pilus modification protein PilV [Xylophilus sp. GOD-11R]WPB55071.1 type IV pilus modification protein PilV [Xylophilus sp. GOD-11R]